MKIFLDDASLEERPTPEGWVRARWPEEVIAALNIDLMIYQHGADISLSDRLQVVTEISLDHDLGDKEAAEAEGRKERTGYDVLLWLEEQVYYAPGLPVPEITIHSANSVGVERMHRAIDRIQKIRSGTTPDDDSMLRAKVDMLNYRIDNAISLIVKYGSIDGSHHKNWVLAQVTKSLMGDAAYQQFKENLDGDWDEGIAP